MSHSFEWDPEKAKKNIRKHKVDFEEASSVFNDPMFITVIDKVTKNEEKFYEETK